MANNVGELIGEVLGLVGIDATDDKYKNIVALSVPIDAETSDKISKNLLSLETAKMSGALKSHFKAQTLNGVDAQHDELAAEYGLSPEQTTELKAIKDTFERNKKLIAKVRENTAKLNEGKGDTAKLIAENQKLNAEVLKTKTEYEAKIAQLNESNDNNLSDYAIMSHLRGLKYANANVDNDVNALTAKNILKGVLDSKKIGVKRGADNSLRLYQLENPELDYLDNHKPISFADLASRELQAKNMLAVSDPNRATGNNRKATPAAGGKEQDAPDNSEAIDFYNQQLEAYK